MTEVIITWNLKLDKTIRFQHRHRNKKIILRYLFIWTKNMKIKVNVPFNLIAFAIFRS
jgi:hypothetical protein